VFPLSFKRQNTPVCIAPQCSRNRCLAGWTVWDPHRGRRCRAGRAGSKKDLITGPIRGSCALQVDLLVLVAGMIPSPGEAPKNWWANTGYEQEAREKDEDSSHQLPRRSARADDRGAGEAAGPDRRRTLLRRPQPPEGGREPPLGVIGSAGLTRRRTSRLKGGEVARRDEFTDSVDTRSKPARRGYGYGERYSFL